MEVAMNDRVESPAPLFGVHGGLCLPLVEIDSYNLSERIVDGVPIIAGYEHTSSFRTTPSSRD